MSTVKGRGQPTTEDELEEAKALWDTINVSIHQISRTVRRSMPWVYKYARKGNWGERPGQRGAVM